MKKIVPLMLIGILIFAFLTGCQNEPPTEQEYEKYSYTMYDTFNTVSQVIGYAKSEEEFNKYAEQIHVRMQELHKLYDKYNDYEGVNNIKTINDNAGVKPVKVDKEIIDLILFCKKNYEEIGTKTNIAMGSVLEIWHDYREEGTSNPENAKIPPMDDLLAANEHTDIDNVIVDVENSTVYLNDPLMSIDVGAVAKGYATEIVVQEVMQEGFVSGALNAGGNVRAFGKPMDGIKDKWSIGIQDPDKYTFGDPADRHLDVIYLTDASVVTSGDYDRFYKVGDMVLHHLIDSETLMPGSYFRAVTVVTENSGMADFLSTTVFLLPYEEGRALVESLGVEAMWIFKDRSIKTTDGFNEMMHSNGASPLIEKQGN